MTRKDFISKVGIGVTALMLPACLSGITGCSKSDSTVAAPSNVDFTIDVSSGNLATNGGFTLTNGIVVARTSSGQFIAVSAACTHEGTTIRYENSSNSFVCPNHGAEFSTSGSVTRGPASSDLPTYKTTLTGNELRVFS